MFTRFKMGKLYQTAGISEAIKTSRTFRGFVSESLYRYARCDWGEMDADDVAANDDAVKTGDRIFAAYVSPDGDKIWIITESDRSYTTILFPEEY